MYLVQVNVIGAQPSQAASNSRVRWLREVPRSWAPSPTGSPALVAMITSARCRGSQVPIADSKAPRAIDIGRINEGHAGIPRAIQNPVRFVEVRTGPEATRSKPQH